MERWPNVHIREEERAVVPRDNIPNIATLPLAAFWVFRAQSLPPPGSDLRTLGSAAAGEAPFLSLKVTIKPALSVKIQSGKWKHLQGLKSQGTGFTGVRPTRDCEAAERVALAGSHQHLQAGRQQGQREWMAGDPVGAGPSR